MEFFFSLVILDRLLFWTDLAKTSCIRRCNLDGSNGSIVIKEERFQPTALAVDQKEDMIYWADIEHHQIEVATIDGHSRFVGDQELIIKGSSRRGLLMNRI
jgi:hypothetical protein